MLFITDLQGKTEGVTDYKSLEINEEINGDFSLSCLFLNTENNHHTWDLIAEESIIEYEGHEFRIKEKGAEIFKKQVLARHIYFDLYNHQIYGITGGTMYPADAFSFALSGSGWTFEIMDNIPPQLLFNFGEDNAVSLIKKAREVFDCEVKICPNKHLKIFKQIGKDQDYQFRYRHNIKAIKETVSTSNLATVIKGYGGNGLEVTYTSPNHSVFGERHAEPVLDENILETSVMTEILKRTLVDTPEVSIELKALLLEGAELGDTVWLIHEKLGIEFQTRIMAQKRRPKTPKADTVTLGNRKKTLSDLLTETRVEINENAKQTRSKIEQTNERITLEVDEINGEFANVNSQLTIQAGQIQQKVSQTDFNGNTITSLITQTPSAISLMAQNLTLQGLVNITSLNSPGAVTIDSGNVYGQAFVVGRGTGSTLTMTAIAGSHSIHSVDAAGFRVSSNGSLSLASNSGNGVYATGGPLVAQSGFRVDGGTSQFNTNVTVNSTLNASALQVQGYPVATQLWVTQVLDGLVTTSDLNAALALKESQIVAWANNKFVAK